MRVVRIQRLVPALDGCDDGVRIGGSGERFRFGVVLAGEAVDGGLEIDDRVEDAALESFAKKPSTALSQEQEVGTKWNVHRGWRSSQARTFGCLWAA